MIGSPATIRTARKEYRCSEHSYHCIRVGDKYLYESVPPWHEMARGKKWMVMRACLRCAKNYGLMTLEQQRKLEECQQPSA